MDDFIFYNKCVAVFKIRHYIRNNRMVYSLFTQLYIILLLCASGRYCRHKLQQENLRAERAGDEARERRLHHRVRHERRIRSPAGIRGKDEIFLCSNMEDDYPGGSRIYSY